MNQKLNVISSSRVVMVFHTSSSFDCESESNNRAAVSILKLVVESSVFSFIRATAKNVGLKKL